MSRESATTYRCDWCGRTEMVVHDDAAREGIRGWYSVILDPLWGSNHDPETCDVCYRCMERARALHDQIHTEARG